MNDYRDEIKKIIDPALYRDIMSLHKPTRWKDYLTILASFAAFGLLLIVHHYFYFHVITAIFFIFLQGFVIHTIAQLPHEFDTHGSTMPKWVGYCVSALVFISPLNFKKFHLQHHQAFPNSIDDPDRRVNKPRNLFEKIIAFTFLQRIFILLRSRDNDYKVKFSKAEKRQIVIDYGLFVVMMALAITLASLGYDFLLLGWLLPMVIGTLCFAGLRVFVEHSYTDRNIPFAVGIPLKAPRFLQYLPFITLYGEGHLVHTYFPALRWYHFPHVIRKLRPYLEKELGYRYFLPSLKQWLTGELKQCE